MEKSLEGSSLFSGLQISSGRMGLLGVAICFCKQNIRGVRNPYSSLAIIIPPYGTICFYTWKVNQEGSWACLLNKGRLSAWASIALLSVKILKRGVICELIRRRYNV